MATWARLSLAAQQADRADVASISAEDGQHVQTDQMPKLDDVMFVWIIGWSLICSQIIMKSMFWCSSRWLLYCSCTIKPVRQRWLLQHYRPTFTLYTHHMELVCLIHMQSMAIAVLPAMLSGLDNGVNFRYVQLFVTTVVLAMPLLSLCQYC